MGMFDYIRCDMPLPSEPAPPPEDTHFQTKDTPAQWMELYVIRLDGRLYKPGVKYEDHSDPTLEGLARLRGMCTPISDPASDTVLGDYHSDLEFYHYADDGEWWMYVARFTDGICVRITCKEYEPPAKKDQT